MDSDIEIQNALEPVILYRVDVDKGDNRELAREFTIKGFPTFVMVNKDGQTTDRWIGYDKEGFIDAMGDAAADPATIDQKKTRLESKPDMKTAAALARYYASLRDFREAAAYYLRAQTLKTDNSQDFSYEIFDNISEGVSGGVFSYDEASQAADRALANLGRDETPWRIIDVSSRMARMASSNNRPQEAARYLQAGLDATASSDDPEIKREHADLMVYFTMMVKGDTASAVEYKKASMPDNWMNNPSQLNAFAWWCFENKTNLEEAGQLSRKSVELAKPGKQKAMNLDTLAEIKFALGNTREAVELSQKAAQEDPSSELYPKQIERFKAELDKD